MWQKILEWLPVPPSLTTPEASIRAAQISAQVALIAAIVAFVSAIIAGIVALRNGYLSVRSSAAIKHADFRQQWINKLRDEMANFQALAINYDHAAERSAEKDKHEKEVVKSMATVLMLMNRKDPDYQLLVDHMNDVVVGNSEAEMAKFFDAYADMVALCQEILKREWEVTKRDLHATAHWLPTRIWLWIWRKLKVAVRWCWNDFQKDIPQTWRDKLQQRRERLSRQQAAERRGPMPRPLPRKLPPASAAAPPAPPSPSAG